MVVDIGWASTDRRFRAMGTDCQVLVVGPGGTDHAARAEQLIKRLERLWSRFDPDSEVSRLGRAGGRTVTVTAETFSLIEKAVFAWEVTDGRFDPTMGNRMVDLGYDRSFETLGQNEEPVKQPAEVPPRPAAGCGQIRLGPQELTVTLPPGVGFDPGGIGKGLAADMVSKALLDAGAWGVLVNLGGDLRVRGTPPGGDAWVVTVTESTVADRPLATVALTDGGLATSTTRKRRWDVNGVEHHHLLDPSTGDPLNNSVDLASAIAGESWWAEAAATALMASQTSSADLDPPMPPGCAALRVLADGTTQRLGDFEGYETCNKP